MKKVLFCLMAVGMIFTCACNSNTTAESSVLASSVNTEVIITDVSEIRNEIVGTWSIDNYSYIFNEDGTGSYVISSEDMGDIVTLFTYEAESGTLTINFDTVIVEYYTYAITENMLSIYTPDGSVSAFTKSE